MKRALVLIATFLLVAGLASTLGGCGKPDADPAPTTTEAMPDGDAAQPPPDPARAATPPTLPEGVSEGEMFPQDWTDEVNPLASPEAIPGGEISMFVGGEPESLNAYLANWVTNSVLFGQIYETLLGGDSLTLDQTPNLARWWHVSADKKVFTFWIDPRARWSDGRPITAHDVKWTFDILLENPHVVAGTKAQLNRFEEVRVLADDVVQFRAKFVHWSNLLVAGSLDVLPRHYFAADPEGKPFEEFNREFTVVSGPYQIGEYNAGNFLVLEKRADWWQAERPRNRYVNNFQHIRLRWYEQRETAWEAFKSGKFSVFPVYTARRWVNETDGEPFRQNWIVKQRVVNYQAIGFQGWPMNMREPPFDDVRVRKAMCHLLNRPKMNDTLMYNQYKLHRSYYEDIYDPEHPCPNPLIDYDVDAARALLAEAGWKVNPGTGVLEKNGQPFEFTFLARSPDSKKFLAIYEQDLEKVGIRMEVKQIDLAGWGREMNKFNFGMTWAAFSGGGPRKDPEPMWSSEYADQPNSANYTGFKNDKVDELIESIRDEFDLRKRNEVIRQIEQIIYNEYPYALLWYIDATRLLYWNEFGTPPTVLGKYGGEFAALGLWWYDPDAAAELKAARAEGFALPRRPPEVNFDDVFQE